MRPRATFEHILVAVAPQNIRALEHEARTASALAVTYPANEDGFRAIESEALQQIFRILVRESWTEETRTLLCSGEDRSVSIPSSIVYEKERDLRR
jgi:hypothetical protein